MSPFSWFMFKLFWACDPHAWTLSRAVGNFCWYIQPAFPNIFYHTMQSYDLQAFEIAATTAVERRHLNRSSPGGLEHTKKSHPSDDSFLYHWKHETSQNVRGTFACDDRSGAETFELFEAGRARTYKKGGIQRISPFFVSLKARDGIRTPTLCKKSNKYRRSESCSSVLYPVVYPAFKDSI